MKSTLLALCIVLSIPFAAKAQQLTIVPGETNNGSKLVLSNNSVKLFRLERYFDYLVIHNDGTKSINLGASTHWCRNGRVQQDTRHLIQTRLPGWFLDNGRFIAADSPSSLNLLKAVCSTYAPYYNES